MIIDTHCHLEHKNYDNLDKVIKNMDKNIIITSGYNDDSNLETIELIKNYENVYGTIGIHPEEVKSITDNSLTLIEENITNNKIVAIGEIGLDYYWDKENIDKQKEIFIAQIALAHKYNKPIVVHSRDAKEDTYNILREYAKGLKGSMHCYSYDLEYANKFIELGFKLGIGGVVTFKNADSLREVVKNIPLEHIILETDSPFLAPVPLRGTTNEPKNTLLVAEMIAKIKGISTDEVIKTTTNNSITQFDLKVKIW